MLSQDGSTAATLVLVCGQKDLLNVFERSLLFDQKYIKKGNISKYHENLK